MAEPAELSVAALLGGRKVLGGITEAVDFVEAVRRGLPFASLSALASALELDAHDVDAVLGLPARTLARRQHARQLSAAESDRLYRVAFVAQLASSALGGVGQARAWMRRPNRGLGGATPFSLLDTGVGCRQVEEALLRLNHGVYA
jgi:putative toxin-antitoxin system antitoxin component (TIGR02293 family)